MRERYNTKARDLIAYFGPSIAPESYVLKVLQDGLQYKAWRPYTYETETGFEVDFVSYAAHKLLEEGVKIDNIEVADVDVFAHPDYFSHAEQGEAPTASNGFMTALRN